MFWYHNRCVYGYGTFNPNEYGERKYLKSLENDYLVKVKRNGIG